MTGPSRKPESSSQVVPVISPAPFSANHAPKTASLESLPRGRTAVTPVRTGPTPTFKAPSPEIRVVWPTSTPLTSVMAFKAPGVPSKGTPRSRARGLVWASTKAVNKKGMTRRMIEEREVGIGSSIELFDSELLSSFGTQTLGTPGWSPDDIDRGVTNSGQLLEAGLDLFTDSHVSGTALRGQGEDDGDILLLAV